MAIPKYKKQYQDMIDSNKVIFDELKLRSSKPESTEFKEVQMKVLRITRKNEDKLCSRMENAHHANFSTTVADKFWEEIRANYPEIDLC